MMADISSIDGYINPWRSTANRFPSQDFADELAKEADKIPGDTKTQAQKDRDAPLPAHTQDEQGNKAATDVQTRGELVADLATPAGQQAYGRSLPGNNSMLPVEAALLSTQQQLGTVVQPIGVTEALLGSRVYGLHLLAGAYLSELVLSETATSDATFHAMKAVPSSATPIEEQATSTDTLPPLKATLLEESSPVDAVVARVALIEEGGALDAVSGAPSQTTATTVSAGAPLAQWLERSLRFIKQPDGSTAVWLRDYRVGDHEAMSLKDSLLQEASVKGVVLSKIMLNGREVWTSRNDT